MQPIVTEKPYQFVPPLDSRLWPLLLQFYLPRYLRNKYGITSVECRHADRLRTSLDQGHGVLLAPNHSRLCDPLVLGILARKVQTLLFAMASWHLFTQDRWSRFMLRRMGGFSVYREGVDKAAITAAIDILQHARRPLVIFPEGAVSRHNDALMALMDGTAFVARAAAKKRNRMLPGGKVVVHPVAIRYFFDGDLQQTLEPVLADIESRLSWQSQRNEPLIERIRKLAEALLSLKEIEYFGRAQSGELYLRVADLIDHLLVPLEEEWSIRDRAPHVVGRSKNLRTAIVPDMVNNRIDAAERQRRWRQLADIYLAQQLSLYRKDYIGRENNLPERVLETVERFEEDLTDHARVHKPLRAVLQVGHAIEVSPQRDRSAKSDPVMGSLEDQLHTMLAELAEESAPTPRPLSGQPA